MAALLETLQSKAPIGLGFVDRDFRRVVVNEALAVLHGSTVAEQLGRTLPDILPLLWPTLEPLYRRVLDTGLPVVDVELDGPSESDPSLTRYWRNSYYPVFVGDEVIGVGIVAVDITEQRHAEDVRRRLAATFQNSADALFTLDVDKIIEIWNPAAARMF
jgi:PAS domain-containing protein